jgi:hypothetical protein
LAIQQKPIDQNGILLENPYTVGYAVLDSYRTKQNNRLLGEIARSILDNGKDSLLIN